MFHLDYIYKMFLILNYHYILVILFELVVKPLLKLLQLLNLPGIPAAAAETEDLLPALTRKQTALR